MRGRGSWIVRPAAEALALSGGLVVLYLASRVVVPLRPHAGALLLLGALVALTLLALRRRVQLRDARRRRHNAEVECGRLALKLQESEARLQSLQGLLAMCSHCKSIRDGAGDWRSVEAYLEQHFQAAFSHGVCPECLRVEYPGLFEGGV